MPTGHPRTTLSLLLTLSLFAGDASACWLTDFLFGRRPAYAANRYAAGYPVVMASGYGGGGYVNGGNFTSGPYVAGRVPVDNANVYTGLPPTTGVATTSRLPITSGYSASRFPVASGSPTALPLVQRNRVPLAGSIRGLATTSNPFYGTGNQYPNNYQGPAYGGTNPYASGTAGAVTASAVPVYPAAPPPRRRGGLARFFGRLLGTDYQTSYYSAPITYYRPVTSVDPVSGTTVTVQQPCTSTVQRLQRTPTTSFAAPISSAPSYSGGTNYSGGMTGNACPPPASGSSYGAAPAYGSAPSYEPTPSNGSPSYGPAPNAGASPGYGASSGGGTFPPDTGTSAGGASGSGSASDRTPMPPPRLDSARPSFGSPADNGRYESDGYNNGGYENGTDGGDAGRDENDRYENGGDGSASNPWRRQNGTAGDDNRSGLTALGRTPARPIPAPDDDNQDYPTTDPSPKVQRLPYIEDDRSRPASENRSRPRLSAPVLEASLIRESKARRPAKTRRSTESGWYSPNR